MISYIQKISFLFRNIIKKEYRLWISHKWKRLMKRVAALRAQRDKDYAEYEAAGRVWGLVPRERITRIKFPRAQQANYRRLPIHGGHEHHCL